MCVEVVSVWLQQRTAASSRIASYHMLYLLPPQKTPPHPTSVLFSTAEEPKTFSMAPFQMLETQIKFGLTKDKEPHVKIGTDWLVASSQAVSGLPKGAATKGGDFPAPHQSGLISPPQGYVKGAALSAGGDLYPDPYCSEKP